MIKGVVCADVLALALACSGRAGDFMAGEDSTSGSSDAGDSDVGGNITGVTSPTTASPTTASPTTASPTTAEPTTVPTTVPTTMTTDPTIDPDTTATATEADTGESSTGASPPTALAHYRLSVVNSWSEATHPGAVPFDAHFSWFGGATHDDAWHLWALGEFTSPGMTQMAEIGPTDILLSEVQVGINAGHVWSPLSWQHWFCPPSTVMPECGQKIVEFDISLEFPLVTLVSMVGPSPDLFVGVSGLPLVVDGQWVEEQVIDIRPFDGGTRSDKDFSMNGTLQEPPLPISKIMSLADHPIGPGTLGTMTFERLF